MATPRFIGRQVEFEWDEGNREKSVCKHGIGTLESEEPFFDEQQIVFEDVKHSDKERRYVLIGKSRADRVLTVIFTMRGERIRIISVRASSRKEVSIYEETTRVATIYG